MAEANMRADKADSQLQVSDLGAVLHMVGGTAASFMIFVLPGLMLVNAAIVKGPVGNLPESANPSGLTGHNQNGFHEVSLRPFIFCIVIRQDKTPG